MPLSFRSSSRGGLYSIEPVALSTTASTSLLPSSASRHGCAKGPSGLYLYPVRDSTLMILSPTIAKMSHEELGLTALNTSRPLLRRSAHTRSSDIAPLDGVFIGDDGFAALYEALAAMVLHFFEQYLQCLRCLFSGITDVHTAHSLSCCSIECPLKANNHVSGGFCQVGVHPTISSSFESPSRAASALKRQKPLPVGSGA